MFINVKLSDPKTQNGWNVSSHSYRKISAKLTGREFQGMRISAVVRYSNRKVRDAKGDLVWNENILPSRMVTQRKDFEEFMDDLYQTANADDVKYCLEYWKQV